MRDRILRREKRTPTEDARHTLRVGLVCFVVLLVVLPRVLG